MAWKALNRRERTVAELARLLAAQARRARGDRRRCVGELLEQGYLDDASYAQRFAEDRRRLDAWGAERIERQLRSLGIDRELIAAAIGEQDHDGELEAALELLARRFPSRRGRRATATGRSACSSARATGSSSRTTRCAATRASTSSTDHRRRRGSRARRVRGLRRSASRYYDPAKRQTGPAGPVKHQQIITFSKRNLQLQRDGDPRHHLRRARPNPGGRARPQRPNSAPSRHLTRRPRPPSCVSSARCRGTARSAACQREDYGLTPGGSPAGAGERKRKWKS